MRRPPLGWFVPDLLIVVLGLAAVAHGTLAAGFRPSAVVFTLGWVGALLARWRIPWSPALVPLIIAAHGVALRMWPNDSAVTMLALFVSAGVFGARMPRPRAVIAAPLWPAAVGVLVLTTSYGESGIWDVVYPGGFMLVTLGGGVVVGRATTGRQAASARAAEVEQELEAHRAGIVAEERARIAQDLRALVAAEIHGIRQRTGRARSLLAQGEVAAAEEVLLQIEDAGRESLADLRHMLGLLRRDMAEEALSPQPGMSALADVVGRAEQRGTSVGLVVEGSPVALPRGIEVVIYRVVERTVEQACRARVPRLAVRVRYETGAVTVQIHGRGLGRLVDEDHLVIRERIVVYGGDLLVGTDEHDRDVLRVFLPLPGGAGTPPQRSRAHGRPAVDTPAEGAPEEAPTGGAPA